MKNMPATDHQLLDHFLKTGDQEPFTELVRRHLGLVHSAAIRITKQASLAEEASQIVFTKLARLRSPMQTGLSLVTWLHRTTRSTAIDLVRAEVRRRNREQIAASLAMNHSSIPWDEISTMLDEVIDKLSPDERHVVLSRYFEGQSHAELGRALGLSEDAVRMRVNRTLEKIRALLQMRGISTTAAALSTTLSAHALAAAPEGLASTVVTTAVASFIPSISITTLGIITMTQKTAMIAAAVLLVAGAGTAVYIATNPKAAPSALAAGSKDPEATGKSTGPGSPDPTRPKSEREGKNTRGLAMNRNEATTSLLTRAKPDWLSIGAPIVAEESPSKDISQNWKGPEYVPIKKSSPDTVSEVGELKFPEALASIHWSSASFDPKRGRLLMVPLDGAEPASLFKVETGEILVDTREEVPSINYDDKRRWFISWGTWVSDSEIVGVFNEEDFSGHTTVRAGIYLYHVDRREMRRVDLPYGFIAGNDPSIEVVEVSPEGLVIRTVDGDKVVLLKR